MELRSYRRVFELERRLYRVDRLRLNPSGVPVRGVVYALALVLASLALARLPVLGAALALLPWYVRDVLAPAALATLLASVRVEGRCFHLAAWSLLGLRARPLGPGRHRRPHGLRWRPHELLVLPGGADGRPRSFRYTGPGTVVLAHAHECLPLAGPARWRRRAALVVRPAAGGRTCTGRRGLALARGRAVLVEAGRRER